MQALDLHRQPVDYLQLPSEPEQRRLSPTLALTFPTIDPVLVTIGPFAIRWYALAYITGLLGGWWAIRRLCARADLWGNRPRPGPVVIDDLLFWVTIGVIFGGRAGYVLFYDLAAYLADPLSILMVWKGGMSFHGGLAGAAVAMALHARASGLPVLVFYDLAATVVPLGLLLGRLANFINAELWGRISDVPWAMVFPGAGPLPRHPSQLYEAILEGALLLAILMTIALRGGLARPGLATGVFGLGYGLARILVEFFREPDAGLGYLAFGSITMGMILSLPLVIVGVWLILSSRREARP